MFIAHECVLTVYILAYAYLLLAQIYILFYIGIPRYNFGDLLLIMSTDITRLRGYVSLDDNPSLTL